MRSSKLDNQVKLGSRVGQDYGPGAFITQGTLEDMMLEQKRAMIGGTRTYGREYDNYYQDRRWTPRSKLPTFTPTSSPKAAKATVKQAATGVAKVIIGRAKKRIKDQAAAAGLGASQQTMFLTPNDLQAAHFGGMGGFGAAAEAPFDLVAAVKDIYATTTSVKPLLGFLGEHPVGSIALLMLVIGAGAAIGGFIGSGGADALKQSMKKG